MPVFSLSAKLLHKSAPQLSSIYCTFRHFSRGVRQLLVGRSGLGKAAHAKSVKEEEFLWNLWDYGKG